MIGIGWCCKHSGHQRCEFPGSELFRRDHADDASLFKFVRPDGLLPILVSSEWMDDRRDASRQNIHAGIVAGEADREPCVSHCSDKVGGESFDHDVVVTGVVIDHLPELICRQVWPGEEM